MVRDLYSLCKSNVGQNQAKMVISEWLERLTLNLITKVIAGNRYFVNEARRVGKIIKEFMYVVYCRGWVDLQGRVKSMKCIARELDFLLGTWVEEHTA